MTPALDALEEGLAAGFDVVVGEGAISRVVDHCDGREDAAYEVGTAGPDVLVGGREQRGDREDDRVVGGEPFAPSRLDPVAGVNAARALRLEVELLVTATRHVVAENPSAFAGRVVAREERHDREALHRGGPGGAH